MVDVVDRQDEFPGGPGQDIPKLHKITPIKDAVPIIIFVPIIRWIDIKECVWLIEASKYIRIGPVLNIDAG